MIFRKSKTRNQYGIFMAANPKNPYFKKDIGEAFQCYVLGNVHRSPSLFYHAKYKMIIIKHDRNRWNCLDKFYLHKIEFPVNKTSTFKISQEMENGKLMFKVWLRVNFHIWSARKRLKDVKDLTNIMCGQPDNKIRVFYRFPYREGVKDKHGYFMAGLTMGGGSRFSCCVFLFGYEKPKCK